MTGNLDEPIAIDSDASILGADDDLASFTESLTSSVVNYNYENGRRYHAFREGAYAFPNDEMESRRLEVFHHLFTMVTDDKLHLAPIGPNPKRILDIGTGTGVWCISMGDEYPSAQVLGNDLSPIQPNVVPQNVKFEIDDAESEWAHTKPFDYIHCRYMVASIHDWPQLVKNSYDHTAPGGWVEFQDYDLKWYSQDDSLSPDLALTKWVTLFSEASDKAGVDSRPGPKLEQWLRDAGFEDVHVRKFRLPVGRWPKDERLKTIGSWNLLQLLEGIEAFTLGLFTRFLKWEPEEVHTFVKEVIKDLRNPKIHSQHDFYAVYGRKPE